MQQPDQLYTLRNLFWVGNYQAAIHEANGLNRLPLSLQKEKQHFLYRSYLALGQYNIIFSEINKSDEQGTLRAILLLAQLFSDPSSKDNVRSEFANLCQKFRLEKTFCVLAATFYLIDDNVKDAIHILSDITQFPERDALMVQICLRMFRLDLATQNMKSIKSMDDDHVLGKLASAWCNLYPGQGKSEEAGYIYEELIEKFGESASLLNGLAVTRLHSGRFEDAEISLKAAMAKNPSDQDTIANLIVVSQHLQRPNDVISRYINQLKTAAPNHPLVASLASFDSAFDRVAAAVKSH